ncbi:immunoglobulin variable region used by the itc63b heavy chain [Fusarium denticulatum]|uniref:Immunoglobulin variable region used by the itc63b heavy chain n=1 Tax=Fusarium denticulatum TaxID=48507 RepID=A0A8H5WJG6_9HYPO|nr:immunoglobulin variable region used by the itc63b heavy chain [Fusarium denticulatum]
MFLLTVECNSVTPWPQGTLAAIEHVAGDNAYVVGCLQDNILQGVRFRQIPVDIHSAAWSGTIQSFIQQRVSNPLTTEDCVSRADECRLLFLSQSNLHVRIPVCQWKPFGKTPVEDVDIEVRVHHQCADHWLQYEGIYWECEDASFGWLRLDDYAKGERNIWNHEWFDMSESDDDMEDDETISNASTQLSSRVETWVLNTKTSTSVSEARKFHSLSQLQAHKKQVEERINALVSSASLSEDDMAQLAQLRETKESICRCVDVVDNTGEAWDERYNNVGDITTVDSGYGFF